MVELYDDDVDKIDGVVLDEVDELKVAELDGVVLDEVVELKVAEYYTFIYIYII